MSVIEAKNLVFRYSEDAEPVLKHVSLTVERGEFVAVLGHNGSGKSTLAKHLNGICIADEGTLKVCGIEVDESSDLAALRRKVGMVFQNPDNQIIASVVEEDVAFALENLGVPHDEMHRRVAEALEAVDMSRYAKHATYKLSGGQKQRIAIAGILAMRPDILVLDEPTAMLDPKGRAEVMEVLHKFHREGMTIVLITHFMDEAAQADRIVVMNDGEVLLDGEPHYVFQNAGLLWSVGLNVPQSTELMFLLREEGYKVPLAVLTEEECIAVLDDLLAGRIGREVL
ncbi:MAG: energy-coupling factor transporter ATPase [Clostridia bacterium]|nr:energy-coupling factor transporter ATPase [Clostridia bacterium]